MITSTSFFGLPLRTPAQRRLLVVLYYLLLVCLAAVGFQRNKALPQALAIQTFILAGLLGGVRSGGPVKAYAEPIFETGNDDTRPLVLGLSTATRHILGARYWTPLDERETDRRNWAHFRAYQLLLWIFGISGLLAIVAWNFIPIRLAHEAPLLLWLLLIVMFSLPQAVLLWTEPAAESAELLHLPSQA